MRKKYTHPKWAFTPSGEFILAYHGTSQDVAKIILEEGIKPMVGKRRYPGHHLYHGDRGKSVFLTGHPDEAQEWAVAGYGIDKAKVLKVHIPANDVNFTYDHYDTTEAQYKGIIPAEWIQKD